MWIRQPNLQLTQTLSTYLVFPIQTYAKNKKKKTKLKTNEILKNQGLTKDKKYFQSFYINNSTPWFARKNLSREFIVTINRIRADHYNLAVSLNRVGIVNYAKCKCNYEYENANHVIWQCER
ncbi:hypothetical protein WN55_04096 [Dufourea novaeangliae]|uniref:Uncharacterized protein n=1 Tax=Dufourea novaeangliae TaxID=178035 RepID=A0A154PKD0_DUFNO|nr:hypothetical protein WN55_04096 [Dufourea novaeangliae]